MKRFRAASSLLLALSVVSSGLVGLAAQSAQAVLCNDGTTQASCENNGGPKPTEPPPPTAPAPTTTTATTAPTTTTAPTAPTPPPGGCPVNTFWNGNSCAPNPPTTTAPTAPTPPPGGCPVNTFWNGNSCAPTSGAGATQTPTIKCADGTFRVTAIECPQSTNTGIQSGTVGQNIQCNDGTGQISCENNGGPKPTVINPQLGGIVAQTPTIKCSDGTLRITAIECEQSVGGKSTVAITCPSNQVVSPSGTYCIYPTTTGTAQGTYRSECAVTPLPASCLVGAPTTLDKATQIGQIATFKPVAPQEVKIQGNSAFDSTGVKIGELAKGSNGQVFQAAPPPPPTSASGKSSTKKPAKTSTAPVIVMNVLGADNKEIVGPDGKPLQTAPVVKQGNFVFTDRNGTPIMTTPTLNSRGEPVVHNGKVLMTKLMTIGGEEALFDASGKAIMMVPLLGEDGKPLLASNGEVLYAPPLLNAAGKPMVSASTGQVILAKPMADSSGNAALGADKKPFMGQPLLTKDDKLLTIGGQEIYTGAVGMPLTNSKKQQVRTANKQDVQFGFGGTLIDEGGNQVLGPDGKAVVMNANATPLMGNGLPLLDKNGKAVRVTSNGQITDSSGRLILGIDGKPIAIGKSESAEVLRIGSVLKNTVKAPDGSVAVMALNAQLFDKSGNPIVTAAGQPIYFDAKSKKLIDPKGNAVKVEAGGKIAGKIASLAFQTVNFAA